VSITPEAVGAHYDELDVPYRELWGEHLHHGVWDRGVDTPEQATRRLVEIVAQAAGIDEGTRVVDVGCGYGATARMLARSRHAIVTGYTVSRIQFIRAAHEKWDEDTSLAQLPRIVLADWLENDLEDASQDVVLAIESVEHMNDRAGFFRQAARVLRPGGRIVLAAWLAREKPWWLERRVLVEPIVRNGRLAALPKLSEHREHLASAGFGNVQVQDLTRMVRRTWDVCIGRALGKMMTNPGFTRQFAGKGTEGRVFFPAMLHIKAAYAIGAMRYGLVVAEKVATGAPRFGGGAGAGSADQHDRESEAALRV
jgi:tocopherol O-methyltransferase